ncbi:MAG TPA: hypothetical protein VNJ03_03075 [Vicinamibacterales bacterium]|nr:hypothetical protein [Vicinamibacterales bacterium]
MGQWMGVLDTLGTLVQAGSRLKQTVAPGMARQSGPETGDVAGDVRHMPGAGALETRLAGVLVAALKEAFDRDRTRMDLERETVEAERARAERALHAELRRQAADRALTQLRLIAVFAGCALLVSAALAAFITGMRDGGAAMALAIGWAAGLAALGCVFAAWPQVSSWAAGTGTERHHSQVAAAAPWLLLVSLALTAVSLLLA